MKRILYNTRIKRKNPCKEKENERFEKRVHRGRTRWIV